MGFTDFESLFFASLTLDLTQMVLYLGSWERREDELRDYGRVAPLSERDRALVPLEAVADLADEGYWALEALYGPAFAPTTAAQEGAFAEPARASRAARVGHGGDPTLALELRPTHPPGSVWDCATITRVFAQILRSTPRPLMLACALALVAAYFASRFPDVPGASAGSYVSTFLIALPSAVALFRYLGPRTATISLLALSAFGYAVETLGVATGLPYGPFYYGEALGPRLFGLVPYLLPVSYVPLVLGAVAASWPMRRRISHALAAAILLVLMDGVLDPGAASMGFWVWPEGGAYYGVPLSNYAGWLLSGTIAATILLNAARWRGVPPPGLLDSAIIALSFWTGISALSGVLFPTLLGATLFAYLLARRSRLKNAK